MRKIQNRNAISRKFLSKGSIIVEVISAAFILLFVYTAVSKLIDYETFKIQLAKSPMLTAFAEWVAWIVPALEIAISIMLAVPRFRLSGLYAAFGLMIIFTAYIIAITQFSAYIPCSCGGVLQDMTWNQHLIFNMAFVVFGLTGILLHPVLSDKPLTSGNEATTVFT